jgi:RHS repeat-associated protein
VRVLELTSNDVVEVQRSEYSAFGVLVGRTTASSFGDIGGQPFGFAGGLFDPITGLTRFGARDYDARLGRWLARDPLGFGAGDTNLFAYVGGDPVNLVDPAGQFPGLAFAGAVATGAAVGALGGAAMNAGLSIAANLMVRGCIDVGHAASEAFGDGPCTSGR